VTIFYHLQGLELRPLDRRERSHYLYRLAYLSQPASEERASPATFLSVGAQGQTQGSVKPFGPDRTWEAHTACRIINRPSEGPLPALRHRKHG
jgi:hypothetical protein